MTVTDDEAGAKAPKRASMGRAYWSLFSAGSVSNLGDGIIVIVFPWLVSTLTRDAMVIAGAVLMTRIPWALFSLPAGVLADRIDRRRAMAIINVLRSGVTLALGAAVATDVLAVWMLYTAALLMGGAEVMHDTAMASLVPRTVSGDQLKRANGYLGSAEMLFNQFVGPPLSGFLIALSLSLPLYAGTASYAVAAVTLLLAGLAGAAGSSDAAGRSGFDQEAAPDDTAESGEPAGGGFWGELRDGFRFVWSEPVLRALTLAVGALNAAATMAISTYVLFVREVLALDARGYGLLMTAGALGGFLGGIVAERISRRLGDYWSIHGVFLVGLISHVVIGLAGLPLAVAAMNFIFTMAAMVFNVVVVSLRQQFTPDGILGRVTGVARWISWGMMPIGALASGLVVEIAGIFVSREWAVRSPMLCAAVIFAGVGAVSLRPLSRSRLKDMQQRAGNACPDPPRP